MSDAATHPSEHRLSSALSHRALVIVMGVAALAAWIYLEVSGNGGAGVVLFVGAFAVLAALAPGIKLLDTSHGGSGRPSPERAPLGERLESLAAPGPVIWLLPFAVLVLMLITLPLAYHHSPGNNAIIGLAFACALLGGTVGTVLGSRLWAAVMVAVVNATGDPAEGPVSPALAVRTSYGVGAFVLVVAVIGSLFA